MDSSSTKVLTTSHCIHTKNIFLLVDLPVGDESYKRILNHVDICQTCQAEFKKIQLVNLEMKVYIPKPHISTEIKEEFEREVTDVFKVLDLNARALIKKNVKTKIEQLNEMGGGMMKHLTSRSMVKSYFLGGILFVLLRKFFN